MKKLAAFGAALAAAFLSFSSFGVEIPVTDEAGLTAAIATAGEDDEIVIAADINLSATAVINRPVKVRGAGAREDTVLKITAKKVYAVEVTDPGAVLKNVTITGSNVGFNEKGGLHLTAGLVTNVVISGNVADGTYAGPAGVNMSGGRLTGSLIANNKGGHAAVGVMSISGNQNDYVAGKGPEVDHCIITGNTMSTSAAQCNGMVNLGIGYLHDCLIADNSCSVGQTAGVTIGSYGVMANCTIANNNSGSASAGGLYWSSQNLARIVNCIIAGNKTTGGNCDWAKSGTAQDASIPSVFLNCLFDGSDIGGTNCKVGDPCFKNTAAGDYRLTAASALARDKGLATWSGINGKVTFTRTADETDCAGNSRIMGDAIDIGAYEFDPNVFSIGFSCETLAGSTATTYQFHSAVLGASGDVAYGWTFLNDMTGESFSSDEANPAFTTEKAGRYTVTLAVDDGVHEPLTETKEDYISVLALTTYANPDSATPAYPYDTAGTAAKTIQEAYDACAAGGEVILAEKTFAISSSFLFDRALTIRGEGAREDTALKITAKNVYAIEVTDPGAVLKNVTITGSSVGYDKRGGLHLVAGLVTNVVISGNVASAEAYAGPAGATVSGGRLTGSLITNNKGGHAEPGVMNIAGNENDYVAGKGPEVDHCIITGNTMTSDGSSCNGMVSLGIGYLHDCLIADNSCGKGQTAGVSISSYGVMANCTIADNDSGSASAGGLYWNSQNLARIVDCIIAGNKSTGGNCDWAKSGTAQDASIPSVFLNCIFDGSDIGGTNCKVGDPGFKNAAAGDYSLTAASALARDKGLATWSGINGKVTFTRTADEADCAGNSRIMGSDIDIGAYEFDLNVFSVGFSCETLAGSTATTYQFHGEVLGASGEVTYSWTFENDMTGESFTSDEANPAFTTGKAGSYTVTLVVDDGVHEPLAETKESYVSVLALTTYANPDSATPAYPYDTAGTAAKTIQEAYDACAAGGEVILAPKTFEISSRFLFDRALTIRGEGAREDTVIQSKGNYLGTMVAMNTAGAVLKNVTLAGGTVDTENTGALNVGATGGTVTNCVIRDCCTKQETIRIGPSAIHQSGGRITGCLITGNNSCHDSAGAVVISGATAVMDHCQILNNTVTAGKSTHGALRIASGALVEDCLIVGNTCDAGYAAGVSIWDGTVAPVLRNCTITANNAGLSGKVGGLYWKQECPLQVINCIIAGNAADTGAKDWTMVLTVGKTPVNPAQVFHNCLFDGSTDGLDNTNILLGPGQTVGFKDAPNGDYSIVPTSICVDNGTEAAVFGTVEVPALFDSDLAGNVRVSGETVDIGAYECDLSQMSCDFSALVTEGFSGQVFALTSAVSGVIGEASYSWRFVCGTEVETSTEQNPFFAPTKYGKYDVSLVVTTEAGSATSERAAYLYLAPRDIYATQGAAAENFPFASAEDATANLQAAYDAAISGSVIHVSGTLDLSAILTVTKAVTFTGVSGSDTDKVRQTANMRVLNVNCAGAVFRGLTLTGGKAGSDYYSGNGVYVGADGGVFEDCCFLKNGFVNSVTAPAPYGAGGGIYVSSGAQGVVIRRCIFRENVTGSGTSGAGAVLGAGLVEDCLFEGNYMDNGCGSAVYLSSPAVKLRNCTFVGNHGNSRDASLGVGLNGAIYFATDSLADGSPEVVNCLFDGNYLKTADEVGNWSAHPQADADNLAAAFTTCAFTAGELPVADDETKAMLVADPGFTDDGTYRLTKKTALRGKGTWQAWMDGTTDLYGMPRVGVQNEVEPGCCAAPKVYGFMLLVR